MESIPGGLEKQVQVPKHPILWVEPGFCSVKEQGQSGAHFNLTTVKSFTEQVGDAAFNPPLVN